MNATDQILKVIEEDIKPALQYHGGDIEFIRFEEPEGKLAVRLVGACGTCPFAQETLRVQVESVIKSIVPAVKSVVREN
ncbi:MAG: NifU family protein [Synergistaceae bacterium]|nr:NifU family protein [Synergistaceae bacterium]